MKATQFVSSTHEPALFAALERVNAGPSHGVEHAARVLTFGKQLHTLYGGDIDVLTASVILHDLGRSNPHLRGNASAGESVRLAVPILESLAFSPAQIKHITHNILDHDQPSFRPRHLEGRILKDADFLSGFGATGIVRSAMWTGESGGTIADCMERIELKMRQRIDSLEFTESRQHALRAYSFVQLFLEKLRDESPTLEPQRAAYIAIEGISGSGKSTQTELLATHFDAAGHRVTRISEPTPLYDRLRKIAGNPLATDISALLFLLDRRCTLAPQIKMALGHGKTVITDRSYLSTMVYQSAPQFTAQHIAYLHQSFPQPSQFIILDLDADIAYDRIRKRSLETGKPYGKHESIQQLRAHRELFLRTAATLPNAFIIDASSNDTQSIHKSILRTLYNNA